MEAGQLTELGMELANDYDDPRWDEVLDQVPFNHAQHILTMDTQYKCPGIEAIGLRSNDDGAWQHAEGASQVGNGHMAPNTSCVGYPGSTVLAQTWNQTLAYMYGKSEGNDMGPAGKDALYSPACNIHRSPFGGRNSGYQSEDPYLSGRVIGNLIRGLGVYGKTSFVKHFALNEQETHRSSNGQNYWCEEQAIRELYLKPFEFAVKEGKTKGVMSSFTRIGTKWTGGNYNLLTGVLRNEWGFQGSVICDFHTDAYMNNRQMIEAGGDLNLTTTRQWSKADKNSANDVTVLRRSAHNNLYALANSNAVQFEIIGYKLPVWEEILFVVDGVISAGVVAWGAWAIVSTLRKKEIVEEAK